MQRSKKYSISWRDVIHGFIMTSLSTALPLVVELMASGELPDLTHLKTYAIIGFSAGVSYLIKKFVTNSDGRFNSEPKNTLQ